MPTIEILPNLAQRTPTEIDTALGELYQIISGLDDKLAKLRKSSNVETWPKYIPEHAAKLGAQQAESEIPGYEQQVQAYQQAVSTYQAEYIRRGRWTRWYVVPGGHIHNTMHCPGCQWKTTRVLQPEMSAKEEAELVQRYGDRVCTLCCPSAPLSPYWRTVKDKDVCEHSGDHVEPLPPEKRRLGRYYPRGIKCACGAQPAITSAGNIRKHKVPADRRQP